jgi:hypothetical protein
VDPFKEEMEVEVMEGVDLKADPVLTITHGAHTFTSDVAKRRKSSFFWKQQNAVMYVFLDRSHQPFGLETSIAGHFH